MLVLTSKVVEFPKPQLSTFFYSKEVQPGPVGIGWIYRRDVPFRRSCIRSVQCNKQAVTGGDVSFDFESRRISQTTTFYFFYSKVVQPGPVGIGWI